MNVTLSEHADGSILSGLATIGSTESDPAGVEITQVDSETLGSLATYHLAEAGIGGRSGPGIISQSGGSVIVGGGGFLASPGEFPVPDADPYLKRVQVPLQ
jgi:hypothetical protein